MCNMWSEIDRTCSAIDFSESIIVVLSCLHRCIVLHIVKITVRNNGIKYPVECRWCVDKCHQNYHQFRLDACIKIKNKKQKYHTIGTVPKSIRKFAERDKCNPPNTCIRDRSLFWLCTDSSFKISGVKIIL